MNKAIFSCITCLTIFMNSFIFASESDDWVKILNIPNWVHKTFHKKNLIKKYDYSFNINPLYLRGDFNGDNISDIAILVNEKSSNKLGIIVIHFRTNNFYILGAGNSIGDGGDDFKWMSNWAVKRREKVGQGAEDKPPPKLKAEALYVEKVESASGIIYWDGMNYVWYQQGD